MPETEIIQLDNPGNPTPGDREKLRAAGARIREGALAAFPTETVYGLGGDALNPESSRRIYAAKGRPSDNPLIVHVCSLEAIDRIADTSDPNFAKLADAFWPGPMTLILPKKEIVPWETTGGLETVAVRMPSDPVAALLIGYAGGYIAAPSANLSGRPSPTDAEHVIQDLGGRVELIIDGGENPIGLESTIVDLTVPDPVILRPGYITDKMLAEALGRPVETDRAILDPDSGKAPKAPGMKYRHYAPKGELTIVEGEESAVLAYLREAVQKAHGSGRKVGLIVTAEHAQALKADVLRCIGSRNRADEIAHNLYRILREFDDEQVEVIYSEGFADTGLGQAIMNRLLKAAGYRVVRV